MTCGPPSRCRAVRTTDTKLLPMTTTHRIGHLLEKSTVTHQRMNVNEDDWAAAQKLRGPNRGRTAVRGCDERVSGGVGSL